MRYGLDESNKGRAANRSSFPAQSSVLDEDALLERVVPDYEVAGPVQCTFFARGDSDVYKVHTEGPVYYLKAYRPPRQKSRAEAEAQFVSDLAGNGIRVVTPVRRRDGAYASQVSASEGLRPILLFTEAPPDGAKPLRKQDVGELGKAVATLHTVADRLDREYELPILDVTQVVEQIAPYSLRYMQGSERKELEGLLVRLDGWLKGLPRQKPDFGLCHADLVLSNIRRDTAGHYVFFDFGNAGFTWRGLDFAVLHESFARNGPTECSGTTWRTFLDGYVKVRPLPERLEQTLVGFRLLRELAWLFSAMAACPLRMGTETFNDQWVHNQMGAVRGMAAELGWQ